MLAYAHTQGVKILEFKDILKDLIKATEAGRSADSGYEHMIRVLNAYGDCPCLELNAWPSGAMRYVPSRKGGTEDFGRLVLGWEVLAAIKHVTLFRSQVLSSKHDRPAVPGSRAASGH